MEQGWDESGFGVGRGQGGGGRDGRVLRGGGGKTYSCYPECTGIRQVVKRTVVFQSLRSVPFDVLLVQEGHLWIVSDMYAADWTEGPSVWGAGEGVADGVGVLFRSWDFEVGSGLVVMPGWVLSVDRAWRGIPFRIVCVYALAQRWGRSVFFQVLGPLLYT